LGGGREAESGGEPELAKNGCDHGVTLRRGADYFGDGGRIGCSPARIGKGGAGWRSQTKFQ
jgi:hypothetical protein